MIINNLKLKYMNEFSKGQQGNEANILLATEYQNRISNYPLKEG
jgi:hypothetical protein